MNTLIARCAGVGLQPVLECFDKLEDNLKRSGWVYKTRSVRVAVIRILRLVVGERP